MPFGRTVPRKPRLVGGVKGHNMNEISFPGSPALIWAESFTEEWPSDLTYLSRIALDKAYVSHAREAEGHR